MAKKHVKPAEPCRWWTLLTFAETLYGKIQNEGEDDQYLETSADVEELAELGETVVIAEYQLVRTSRVTTKVNWESLKMRKRVKRRLGPEGKLDG